MSHMSFGIFFNANCLKYTLEKPEGAIKNGQSRDTGNIRHTRHMIKRTKAQYNTEHQIPGVKPGARAG